MDDEGLIAQVDDARDPVAGLQGGHGAGDELAALPIFHNTVIVAVLYVLQHIRISQHFYFFPNICAALSASVQLSQHLYSFPSISTYSFLGISTAFRNVIQLSYYL